MESFLHDLDWVLPLRNPVATALANGFTWFGYLPFFLTFLSLGFWLWDRERFLRLAILLAISAVVFAWLKDYWQDPRPDIRYALDPRVGHSFGRPSGHAMTTVVLWGWLAYEVRRPWMWMAALLMIIGVCLSRLYLGVHDMDDVLWGVMLGMAALFLFRWSLSPPLQPFRALPVWAHLLVIGLVIPFLWILWPPGAEPPSYVTGDFLLLAGALAGLSIDRRLAPGPETMPFSASRIAFAVIGIVLLFQFVDLMAALGRVLDIGKSVWSAFTALLLGLFISLAAPAGIRALTALTEKAIRRAQ